MSRHVVRYIDVDTRAKDYKGFNYVNSLEAAVAKRLDNMPEIASWEQQHYIDIKFYDQNGNQIWSIRHKVDFMGIKKDGSVILIEAKGAVTEWYKQLLRLIDHVYLPCNLDTEYEIWRAKTPGRIWRN